MYINIYIYIYIHIFTYSYHQYANTLTLVFANTLTLVSLKAPRVLCRYVFLSHTQHSSRQFGHVGKHARRQRFNAFVSKSQSTRGSRTCSLRRQLEGRVQWQEAIAKRRDLCLDALPIIPRLVSLYVYMYICVCLCIYIYTYTCVFVHSFVRVCVYVYVCTYTWVRMYTVVLHMVYLQTCMHICIYVFICVCVHIFIQLSVGLPCTRRTCCHIYIKTRLTYRATWRHVYTMCMMI